MSAALHDLQAINMDTHRYSSPLHTASHEQPQTRWLVASVGAFTAPSSVLLLTWPVHQDLGIIGSHLFPTTPLTNNLGLDVWLLRWERLLPLPVDSVLLPV